KGFVLTGANGSRPLETSRRGVFAIGDIRANSTKRVAAAVGEGAQVVATLHAFLSASNRAPLAAPAVARGGRGSSACANHGPYPLDNGRNEHESAHWHHCRGTRAWRRAVTVVRIGAADHVAAAPVPAGRCHNPEGFPGAVGQESRD